MLSVQCELVTETVVAVNLCFAVLYVVNNLINVIIAAKFNYLHISA